MASYKKAIEWIALNDDTEWLDDDEPMICVAAALTADLFGKSDKQIITDLRKFIEKEEFKRCKPQNGTK